MTKRLWDTDDPSEAPDTPAEFMHAQVTLLRPQPGDILVITGVDLPPMEYMDKWSKAMYEHMPEAVKLIVIQSEDAEVRLQRERE